MGADNSITYTVVAEKLGEMDSRDVERYAAYLEAALEREFPDADVRVRTVATGAECLSWQRVAVDTDDEAEAGRVAMVVHQIAGRVWDTAEWAAR